MEEENPQFPLHIQTGDGEFIVKEEEDLSSPTSPDYFASPEGVFDRGVRLKRRRRCGQCGPCQVKENCNKCHFCLRRDVLKQTCMYRKCVYLRSKPKPYARPKETPLVPSSTNVLSSDCHDGPASLLAASGQNRYSGGPSPPGRNDTVKPPNRSDVAKPMLPPKISDHFPYPIGQVFPSFEPIIRHPGPCASSPPSVNTTHKIPTNSSPGISTSVIAQHPVVPGVPGLMDQSSTLPHNHQMVMPPPPAINDFTDRTFSEFRSQHMLGMPHSNSQVHAASRHFAMKDSQDLPDIQFPPYNRPDSQRSSAGPSSCVYPHGISPSMSGFSSSVDNTSMLGSFDRQTRAFFPSNADMFRHFPPLPPGYSYPPGRYGQNFTSPHYPRFGTMGMPPPAPPPPPPNLGLRPQGGHAQPWGFSSSYSSCEQSNGCPKNGCCPPVSQSLGSDAQVMQEIYGNIHSSKTPCNLHSPIDCSPSNLSRRPESALSDDSGRMSMVSSDFECDVISIDDCQMNALIRSDGSNSLQIEIDSPGRRNSHKPSKFSMDSILATTSANNTSPNKSTPDSEHEVMRKCTIKGTVYVKQDLGDSGLVQLEIPGDKVTLEDSYLDDKLAGYSSNLEELLEFIKKKPQTELLSKE